MDHHKTEEMAKTKTSSSGAAAAEEMAKDNKKDKFEELLETLPKERSWKGQFLYYYQNFWCPSKAIKAVVSFQNHFQARDTDVILTSPPNSGTTWLKALAFVIVNRRLHPLRDNHDHPLLTAGPHGLVPFFEFDLYLRNPSPNLNDRPEPRIFSTHMPYASLPHSIEHSECKIVYVCRNPLDQFVSHRQFLLKLDRSADDVEELTLEDGFDMFCRGIQTFGPFWDHVLGFWNASIERPDKVLFMKYEDMKKDSVLYVKKIADFLGYPFSVEEEQQGVMEEISRMCSFESMKEFQVHKSGKRPSGAPNNAFFRKGQVGDWTNYLTMKMAERAKKIIEQKLGDSGLTFEM